MNFWKLGFLFGFVLNSSLLFSQNLLDSTFENRDCDISQPFPPDCFVTTDQSCILTQWKAAGETSPQYIEDSTGGYFAISFGTTVQVDSFYELYRDYLIATFNEPLEAGIWYNFKADMRCQESATIGIMDFEVFFGTEDVQERMSIYSNRGIQPQIRQRATIIPYNQFDYRTEWNTMDRFYKAEGGETCLIIGNFSNDHFGFANISLEPLSRTTGNLPNASYHLRNIRLEKIIPPANYYNEIPESLHSGDEITLTNIEFETGQAQIQETSYPAIRKLAETLIRSGASIRITGHTDNTGTEQGNLQLSSRRANALRRILLDFGVPAGNMTIQGRGQGEPVADNATAEGRARNRRVEIVVLEISN